MLHRSRTLIVFGCVLLLACMLVTAGCKKRDKNIVIPPPALLQIMLAAPPEGMVGAYYSYTLSAANGTEPYNWNIAGGSLPDGLTLDSATGLISGTPTTAGTFSFTVMVTDSAATPKTDTAVFTIEIEPPGGTLQITSSSPLTEGTEGSQYSVTLTATGGITPYSWTVTSGSLPDGLSLNSATGTISGTPTVDNTFTFTVEVTDSYSTVHTASKSFSLTINPIPPLQITTDSLPAGMLEVSYTAKLEATGGVLLYIWSITSGALPDGLNLNTDTGEISSTPTKEGTFDVTVSVTDSGTPVQTAAKTFSVTVEGHSEWEEIDSVSFDVRIPAGKGCHVYFDSKSTILNAWQPENNLTALAEQAIEWAPDWLAHELAENLSYLSSSRQDACAQLILDASDPYVDEVAFCVAHIAPEDLSEMELSIIKENAEDVYAADDALDYVEVINCGDSGNDPDYYSTTKYWVKEEGNLKQIELPKEIYYWFIVHPKITVELPSYVSNYFWRDYLFNESDSGYPVLKEKLAGCETLWNCINNSIDSNGAVGVICKWVRSTLTFTTSTHETQPLAIYHNHRGTCTVHARLTAAASRSVLIPGVVTGSFVNNHKWNEFYERRWIQLEPHIRMIDNAGYYDKWDVTGILNYRGDGYTWTVTERYTKTCTLKVDVKDEAGNPVDGAHVVIESPGGWPREFCTVGYTDTSGTCKFFFGDERQVLNARIYSSVGNIGRTRVISSSVADEVYSWSPVLSGHIPVPSPSAASMPPNPLDEYKIDFAIDVHSEMMHGTTPDNDIFIFDGSTFCYVRNKGSADFFICNSSNFTQYTSGSPFEAFQISPDVSSKSGDFLIPTDDDWYLVLSNKDCVATTKVVSVTMVLSRKR